MSPQKVTNVDNQNTLVDILKISKSIESNLTTLIDTEAKNIQLLCTEIELIKVEKAKIDSKLEWIQERLKAISELVHQNQQYLRDREKDNQDWLFD